MLNDVFTEVLTLLNGIKSLILNFFFMSSEKGARVLVEDECEEKIKNVETRQEAAPENEARKEEEDEEEEEEEEEDEEEEEEDEDEEDDDDEDDDEDDEENAEEEDKTVVENDCIKIPPKLCSTNCHIHKLNLCEKKDIKLLCYYLEKCSDLTEKSSSESEISNSSYCKTFNKIINVYNDKTKCKDGNSDNEYCQEVKQCRDKYPNKNLSKLKCTEEESSSLSQEPATGSEQLQVEVHESPPLEHGTGSDSITGETRCGPSVDISHPENKSLEISPRTEEIAVYVQPNCDVVSAKEPLGGDDQIAKCVQVQPQTLTSSDTNESYITSSTSSISCQLSNDKKSCEKSLVTSEGTHRETIYHLSQSSQEHTINHSETHMHSKEETGSASTTITSASTVLGIPFFVFMLYKFTHIGSLLHNKIIKKGKITEYINGDSSDEMLNEYFMYDNSKSQEKGCSIPYHSV
ncbi:PIR protein [Plasmodium ovale]|uniref:PIR protein n=1 Tax=Plasmodium ovale TaxID=36330 RepID=A0A1D3JD40_PLAOA|nr:PIR protein [Plasmodium ovale]